MQIVLARLDEDFVMAEEGQPDIGRPHKFKAVPKPIAAMWTNKGKPGDVAKAEAYVASTGDPWKVFVYKGEKDPLGRAKRDVSK